ncbi:hypothetical protein CWI37_0829p0010 [Hamiltosporidium tvaerminnensis]|uniref:Uncharacterized protein n=1 Tax=Hamiltosporidium tvaerminnensis TaxID=1176355 RepID=A0A4Q9L3C9_9MICR|nr:hypothetical protein CWI37_0829p0010 [Hamiltosporidium tvaerminnensis]
MFILSLLHLPIHTMSVYNNALSGNPPIDFHNTSLTSDFFSRLFEKISAKDAQQENKISDDLIVMCCIRPKTDSKPLKKSTE